MRRIERDKLDRIIASLEALQNSTLDDRARDSMGRAKDILLQLWSEQNANRL